MNRAAHIGIDRDGVLSVRGDMIHPTIPGLLAQSTALLAGRRGDLIVDLSKVRRVDSAGLTLLIEWIGWARKDRKQLRFRAVPSSLLGIARLSGVDGLLS